MEEEAKGQRHNTSCNNKNSECQFIDQDEIVDFMLNLEQQQRTTSEVIALVRLEQARAWTMKKGILGLAYFAIALSASNLLTTWTVATIAKNKMGIVQSSTNDLVDFASHERLGTTSKMYGMRMNPVSQSQAMIEDLEGGNGDDEDRRRRLQKAEAIVCNDASANSGYDIHCEVQGEVFFDDAVKFYQSFCPSWPDVGGCSDGGVFSALVTCNGKHSEIFGGMRLPPSDPALGTDLDGKDYVMFPSADQGFEGIQEVIEPDGSTCSVSFRTSLFCLYDETQPCYVFTSWEPGQCESPVQLCGEEPSQVEDTHPWDKF